MQSPFLFLMYFLISEDVNYLLFSCTSISYFWEQSCELLVLECSATYYVLYGCVDVTS